MRRCMVLLDIMNRSNVSWHHDEGQTKRKLNPL